MRAASRGLTVACMIEQRTATNSRELVEASLACIERLNPKLNAFRRVMADSARAAADNADARRAAGDDGPLLGVPVAVKANMNVDGPSAHEVVRRLRAAGAVIVGTTNLPDLALWGHFTSSEAHGVTRNPWNLERSPGGSSGGAAAAVASGMVAAAVGSDGGGSIRLPSAMCGLFGLKPQRDRVPLTPDEGHWHGLTAFGPIARSVADAARLLDAIADGGRFADAAERDPQPLRIGIALKPTLPNVRPSKSVKASVAATADRLRELGHEVVDVKPRYGMLLPVIMPRYLGGVADDLARVDRPEELEKRTHRMAAAGRRVSGRPLRRALEREQEIADRINGVFDEVDLMITPMIAKGVPEVGVSDGHGAFRTFNDGPPYVAWTAVWNYTGQPAAALPVGFDEDGMPQSVQLVAKPHDERTLIAVAAQLERALGVSGPWPPIS
jgi:amidase